MITTQSFILNSLLFCFCGGDFVDLHADIAYHGPRTHNIHCGLGLDQIPLFHKSADHAKIIAYIFLYDYF